MERTLDFNQKRGFICDMDGVIYHGNRILPGVPEFIQWLHDENKVLRGGSLGSKLTLAIRN